MLLQRQFIAFIFPCIVLSSFLAVGPPAAPPLHSLNSSNWLTYDYVRTINQNVRLSASDLTETASWLNESSMFNLTSDAISSLDEGKGPHDAAYYWLGDGKQGHKMPLAGNGYRVFRNVKEYGAVGDGVTDDWQAIQAAVTDGGRCGVNCNATSVKGAIIYFPPGAYAISKPIVQYYYSAFVGNPNNRAIIKGLPNFSGIGLIDTNFYIEGVSDEDGNGVNWWINQNNFYRQIRNLILDMREMPNYITGGPTIAGEGNLPVGIHWQVSQASTLQYIDFILPQSSDVRHVGIFQENGSGGFVSDLVFIGGKYCWAAGSQQYTARHIKFRSCKIAIHMIWDWGWTWKNIDIQNSDIGIDVTEVGQKPVKLTNQFQGVGSLTVLDSQFVNVKEGIRVNRKGKARPAIFLDNISNSGGGSIVKENGGAELLGGANSGQWGLGWRFNTEQMSGQDAYGPMKPSSRKPSMLLASGTDRVFERSKPHYANLHSDDFLNILRFGVKNDGSVNSASLNTKNINVALKASAYMNKVVLFPAGIYAVDDTIDIPIGARVVGVLWPQIMAVGNRFSNAQKPKVLANVGEPGQKGVIELSDLLFTTHRNTAGAILMKWNVHEDKQGSAAMWDVIFRVGGAAGTDLTFDNCPWTRKFRENSNTDICMASSMMLHITRKASIYMENMWFWVADHDIESQLQDRVNVYGGRGILIESQGPSWIYSASNEHSSLYNWQLSGAKNIFLGQIQSETPYYQAGQLAASLPYPADQGGFKDDPTFEHCLDDIPIDTCKEAWALRILDSSHVYLYGGGFYSFFNDYKDKCAQTGGTCQDRLIDTSFSEEVWLYNVYTVGAKEVISPQGLQSLGKEKVMNGFATAISAWLLLAGQGKKSIGGTMANNGEGFGFIYLDSILWRDQNPSFFCQAPCNLALPPKPIYGMTTISIPGFATRTYLIPYQTGDITLTKTIITTVSYIPLTTSRISFYPLGVRSGQAVVTAHASLDPPPILVTLTLDQIKPLHNKSTTIIGGIIFMTKTIIPTPRPTDWNIIVPITLRPDPARSSPRPSDPPKPSPLCSGRGCGCVGDRCNKRSGNKDRDNPPPCGNPLGCDKNGGPCKKPGGCSGQLCTNPFGCGSKGKGCSGPSCGSNVKGNRDDKTVEDDKEEEEDEEEEEKCEIDPLQSDFSFFNPGPGNNKDSSSNANGGSGGKGGMPMGVNPLNGLPPGEGFNTPQGLNPLNGLPAGDRAWPKSPASTPNGLNPLNGLPAGDKAWPKSSASVSPFWNGWRPGYEGWPKPAPSNSPVSPAVENTPKHEGEGNCKSPSRCTTHGGAPNNQPVPPPKPDPPTPEPKAPEVSNEQSEICNWLQFLVGICNPASSDPMPQQPGGTWEACTQKSGSLFCRFAHLQTRMLSWV